MSEDTKLGSSAPFLYKLAYSEIMLGTEEYKL